MKLMRFIRKAWDRLGNRRPVPQLLFKLSLFLLVLFFTNFPNPLLFIKQVGHYRNTEALIQTDFDGIAQINSAIDSLLQDDKSPERELKVIQWYVYKHIPYKNDWDNWLNSDYWPTAQETWQKKAEDCDGQAILAVSIMRSRGYPNARLAANFLHVWAIADSIPLMGAMEEETFSLEKDKFKIAFPSLNLFLQSAAYTILHFPAIRIIIIIFTALMLCFHPATNKLKLLLIGFLALLSILMLKDWAQSIQYAEIARINFDFILGMMLAISGFVIALTTSPDQRRKKKPVSGSFH